jgi:hypothetical protein
MQKACELGYDPAKERIQERNYQLDLRLRKLKECP